VLLGFNKFLGSQLQQVVHINHHQGSNIRTLMIEVKLVSETMVDLNHLL
jgi:hypothetical protein